jgi:hypothetical protein
MDIHELRSLCPAQQNKTYFNYLGQGPLPTASLEAITASWQRIQELCPFTTDVWPFIAAEVNRTRRNDAFHIGNSYTSAVEENCLAKLKVKPFTIRYAIDESYVLADGQKPGTREFQVMSECLKQLGFEKEKNPTADDNSKTRKWTFTGTGGTGSAQGSVPVAMQGPDLVRQPFDEVKRIYETFGLRSWDSVQAQIRQRIEQSATYQTDPVVLERPAEQRLRELMGVG